HLQAVSSVAFSPDGKLLATGSLDKTVKLWNAASGKEIGVLRTSVPFPVTHVEFSPDGKMLAAIETQVDEKKAGRVSVYTLDTLRLKFSTIHDGQTTSMAFSPDERFLATTDLDKNVWLSDASRGGKLVRQLTGHKGNTNSVKFSPDGKILA